MRPADETGNGRGRRPYVAVLTVATFVVLLAGDFGLDRVGVLNPFPLPERTMAAIAILVLSLPRRDFTRVSGSVVAVCALLVTLALSYGWAPPTAHGGTAAIDAVTAGLLVLSFFYQCRAEPQVAVRALAVAVLSAGVVYAGFGLLSPAASTRLSVFGGGPNVFARVTGAGVLASFYLYAVDRRARYLLFVPPLVVATFLSGSRGGMVALAVAMVISSRWLIHALNRRLGVALLVFAGSGAAALTFFRAQVENMFAERIVKLTLEERYSSGRDGLIPSAIEMFRSEPLFGWGIEGWKGTVGRSYSLDYPHNLPAQLAAELGLVGLSLLVLAVALYLLELARVRRVWRDTAFFSMSGFVFVLTASQVSGDYYDARMMWIYMAIPGALLLAADVETGSRRATPDQQPVAPFAAATGTGPGGPDRGSDAPASIT